MRKFNFNITDIDNNDITLSKLPVNYNDGLTDYIVYIVNKLKNYKNLTNKETKFFDEHFKLFKPYLLKINSNYEFYKYVRNAVEKNNKANLNFLDVSDITIMSNLFLGLDFHGDISKWDVSNVNDMDYMFNYSSFNGDISNWNVSNVYSMKSMFSSSKFNSDISHWNVSNVTRMNNMFERSSFNLDISNWNVSNVRVFDYMFFQSSFDLDISKWDVKPDSAMTKAFTSVRYISQLPDTVDIFLAR